MCSRHRLTSLSKNTTLSWTHFTSPIRMEGRPLRCGGRAESVHRTGARLDVKEAGVHACGEEALLLVNWARTLSSEVLLLETVHRQVRTTNISKSINPHSREYGTSPAVTMFSFPYGIPTSPTAATERTQCKQHKHKMKVQPEQTTACLWLESAVVICIISNLCAGTTMEQSLLQLVFI